MSNQFDKSKLTQDELKRYEECVTHAFAHLKYLKKFWKYDIKDFEYLDIPFGIFDDNGKLERSSNNYYYALKLTIPSKLPGCSREYEFEVTYDYTYTEDNRDFMLEIKRQDIDIRNTFSSKKEIDEEWDILKSLENAINMFYQETSHRRIQTMNQLNNVVVTGTSTGIGEAIARKFLELDYHVIGIDISPTSSLFKYDNYEHYECDVSKESELPDIENVNILINNAGTQHTTGLSDLNANMYGTYYCTEKYGIQENIKAIVNIVSASAHTGAEFPGYVLSKGAILPYTKNVAMRIAKWKATCNSISPGGVYTDMNKHIIDDTKLHNDVLNETMLNRWATCDEIAEWTYFLAVINKSMTAQDILIDNGEKDKQNFIW